MHPLLRRTAVCGLVISVLSTAVPAAAGPTLTRRARVASGFVVSVQKQDGSFPGFSPLGTTADAVVSLVAAKRGPKAIANAVEYLKANVADADTIGEKAKLVLAAVAAGEDPLTFGGQNLVQQIADSEQQASGPNQGRYGATTEVFNHALAMLALEAAPTADPSTNALTWLVAAQCGDGGWQFDEPPRPNEDVHCFSGDANADWFRSDTNTTSYAVQAIAAHPQATAPLEKSPFRFFRQIRDPEKKGWGYDWTFNLTDTNSTSLAIQAFKAAGKALPKGSIRALKRLQYRLCGRKRGAFAATYEKRDDGTYRRTPRRVRGDNAPVAVGATVGGILGLLRKPLPVAFAQTRRVPKPTKC